MFVGEFKHSVDEKGRVALPAKFREVLKDGAILTRGNDGCLTIYRMNEWESLMEKITKLPQSKMEVRSYVRFLLSGAVDVRTDKQGRINLPNYLMSFAQITKKVVFVGVYDRLELWDEEKWSEYRGQIENQSEDVLEQLEKYGL
jgi:MraZ protein